MIILIPQYVLMMRKLQIFSMKERIEGVKVAASRISRNQIKILIVSTVAITTSICVCVFLSVWEAFV